MTGQRDPRAVGNRLARALLPASVAVVGVSEDPMKTGSSLARSIVEAGFDGDLHFINPKPGRYLGYEFVSDLAAVPAPTDLVIISVPGPSCPGVIKAAGELGCGGALVVSNGFAEACLPDLQDELVAAADSTGIPLIGPNCMGLYSQPVHLNAMGDAGIPPGRVAVVAQSGSVGIAIYHSARAFGLGLSYFISLGNQADVAFEEVLEYLGADDSTDVILLYIEGFRDVARFLDVAGAVVRQKPVAVLRGGRTAPGARGALSHTGSLVGEEAVTAAALRTAGIVDVDSIDELLVAAVALSDPTPMRGCQISVVADSGGYAVLAADAAVRAGLEVSPHSARLQERLRQILVPKASPVNPVDLVASLETIPDVIQRVIEACLRDSAIDGVVLAGSFGWIGDFRGSEMAGRELAAAAELVTVRDEAAKPIAVQTIYADSAHAGLAHLRAASIPVVTRLDDAMKVLAMKASMSDARRKEPRSWSSVPGAPDHHTILTEDQGREWLERSLPRQLGRWYVVNSAEAALRAVADLDGPAVIKVLSDAASHKSDIGGVLLNIRTDEEVRSSWSRIESICRELHCYPSALVTAFETGAFEAFLGVIRNPELGPVVVVGSGGVFAESIADRRLLFPPFTVTHVGESLETSALGRVLRSARATTAMRDRFLDLAVAIGDVAASRPELAELDLNPVLLTEHGPSILDVRVILASQARDRR